MPPAQIQHGVQQDDKTEKLKELWNRAFQSLGIDGLDKQDATLTPLSGIKFGHSPSKEGDPKSKSNTQGKNAVLKRLENGQIINDLSQISPELAQNAKATVGWLGADKKDGDMIAAPTVTDLLKRLFGTDNFETLIGKNFPTSDEAKPQVPPQPPKGDGTMGPTPQGSMDQNTPQPDMSGVGGPPMGGGMGAQPQAPQGMQPPMPTNPMQPPAGAFMGLW